MKPGGTIHVSPKTSIAIERNDPLTTRPSFIGDPPVAAERDALPDRRELALVAVERTRMPMVVSDPRLLDNPIVLANQAFLNLTGYAVDEVLGRNCRFLQGPETSPDAIDRIRRGIAADEHHVELELVNYRKDGSAFLNQLSISPVHDEAGRTIYHFSSQKDVTARRRAEDLEATERLLLKEVDHRALNALALVQSIVRLSRADDVASFSAAVIARVDALARAHRLLASGGWAGAEMAALVAAQTPAGVAARVSADGPAGPIPADLVQPVMLVLHELMTNAARHGALATAGGALAVRWGREADALLIDWREHGASAAAAPTPGFGLKMVRGVVERQLGGRLGMEWPEDGLRARLHLPLAR